MLNGKAKTFTAADLTCNCEYVFSKVKANLDVQFIFTITFTEFFTMIMLLQVFAILIIKDVVLCKSFVNGRLNALLYK